MESRERKLVFFFQLIPLILFWGIALGFGAFVIHLITIATEFKDVPSAAVGISLVAVPIQLTMVSVLTYVFVVLKRGKNKKEK